MSGEKLSFQPITPITQSFEMSCVPASLCMVLSGFGINTDEHELIDKYFPGAKLPGGQVGTGVEMSTAVNGMVETLRELDLQNILQVDIFLPFIWEFTTSKENFWVVRCRPKEVKKSVGRFKHSSLATDVRTLAGLAQRREIGVYSVNSRMMKRYRWEDTFYGKGRYIYDERTINKSLAEELVDFVRRGHSIGTHESIVGHAQAIDGNRTLEEGFWIVDPAGKKSSESYNELLATSSLIRTLYHGQFSDGMFDYLIRISQREEDFLNPQQQGFRRFLQNLRGLIP